ncbi:MAG: VCBS repeat-containing protein [Bacteroidetes bacterium]|nr:VCBS repeat-containing protein [Bacteroidota bacterium]
MKKFYCVFFACAVMISCSSDKSIEREGNYLFTKLSAGQTNIDFVNRLQFDSYFNIYTYRNFYNGGGVALGDINNDGLIDIYFSANQLPNKLYLNKGNFTFEDITEKAGVAGNKAWSTGVSMADVNGDGWLDIYVCNSGDVKGDNRENELFINNGDMTFKESAKEYNLADRGFSTHAAFFDYDNDGDLDVYILNNSYQSIGSFNLRKNERGVRNELGGHKLMRNDNNHFKDVSVEAGIYGSIIAFGLGVTVGDINKDGWQDIYVSNDFFERDYLYINNKNGTFTEHLPEEMKSISGASMGADLADINNDTYPDIFVTEMLPNENARIKTVTTFENWDRYQYNVTNGYHHQFTRNMLQLNNANNTFSDIGRLAKVEATDWSWGALMFDADNDGWRDIFVANGIYQDLTNQDFLQYASSEEFVKSVLIDKKVDYKKLIDIIPSHPVSNFFFKNDGNLKFPDETAEWGVKTPGFSNGSAYGDLDNDGDLDLVINNVNMEAFVYKNEAQKLYPQNHYLKFILEGSSKNPHALGAKITIQNGIHKFYAEQMPMRGFESTVDDRINFGLGDLERVDKVTIEWPNGTVSELDTVKTNQILTVKQKDAEHKEQTKLEPSKKIFTALDPNEKGIGFRHIENDFVDFDRDRLIYHMMSTEGPKLSTGDFNKDGLTDFYIGGAKDQPGNLYVQNANGKFSATNLEVFSEDKASEDLESVFFDADGNGTTDLYVCSGGNEFSSNSTALINRLYLNDKSGKLKKSNQLFPTSKFESTSCVKTADYDKDGDLDLFVGVRLEPFKYGIPCNGYLLQNDGKGNFKEISDQLAPGLKNLGMIKDAEWVDVDADGDSDLIVVGEWMGITLFINEKGKLINRSKESGLEKTNGWWNTIAASDLDHDGDIDFVVGNHGLNSRFRASIEKPVTMYVSDFDKNGSIEQIVCTYNGEKSYPMALRHDLISQIPSLKKKFLKYESYKDATMEDIFSQQQLSEALKLEADVLTSSVLINDGKGKFALKELPVEAQFSPMFGIETGDFDGDGNEDILMGGNLYRVKPEVGRYDASYGVFLKGDGKGNFSNIKTKDSGFFVDGEVRDIKKIKIGKSDYVLVARNNDTPLIFKINP